MWGKAISVVALCALVFAPISSASAQEVGTPPVPLVEVSAGYAFMRDTTVEENFPAGWYFSAATNVNNWFGIAGEVTGAHKKFVDEPGLTVKANLYTFMGGPRFFVKRGRVVPFAQFLAGAVQLKSKASLTFPGLSTTERDTETEFAIQPGGGVTVLLTENVAVRGQLDYRRIMIDEDGVDDTNEFRCMAGFVFGWGAR